MKQIALDIGVSVGPSLANFHPGHNAAALAHLELWMAGRTRSPVPTYLWGHNGSGKTHLLQAVAHHIEEQGALVGWMDKSITQPEEFNPQWEVVLLDDVQDYSAVQQHAAFNWFVNALTPKSGQPRWVLASGTLPPADLKLRDDLRSRLGWGHVYALQVLSEPERLSVLKQEAELRGLHLSEEVMSYMLNRFSRDLGSLMTLLDHLDQYALQAQRAVTIPLIKSMLESA